MATKRTGGKITKYQMPYHFNEAEMLQIGQDLLTHIDGVREAEYTAKTEAKKQKDLVEKAKGLAYSTESKLKSGMEYREVSARMIVNFITKKREFYSTDTDEFLGEDDMQPGDEQLSINDLD